MINYLAVLVSAGVAIAIGSIWWGPLFGKFWAAENGLDKLSPEQHAEMKKSMNWMYVQQFVLSFIQAWVLAFVLQKLGRTGAIEGIKYAGVLWLGFIAPIQYGANLWGNKGYKIVSLTLLNSLITMMVMGAIIGAW